MSRSGGWPRRNSWFVLAAVGLFLVLAGVLRLTGPDSRGDEAADREARVTAAATPSPEEPTSAGSPTPSATRSAVPSPPASSPTRASTPASTAPSSPGGGTDPESGLRWIDEVDLPPEAWDTLQLIDDGGPFPHDEDDGTFGNFEGVLPDRDRGYYREYTVETPGLSHRGARRIVAGDDGEFYWTEDHYQSFERIRRP